MPKFTSTLVVNRLICFQKNEKLEKLWLSNTVSKPTRSNKYFQKLICIFVHSLVDLFEIVKNSKCDMLNLEGTKSPEDGDRQNHTP